MNIYRDNSIVINICRQTGVLPGQQADMFKVVNPPPLALRKDPLQDILPPPRARTAHPLPPFHFHSFSISLPFLLSFCFSPPLSCIIYQFYLSLYCPPLSLFLFLPFLYHSHTSLPVRLYLGLVPTDYTPHPPPPLNFSVSELSTSHISSLPQTFSCLSVHIIMYHGLLALQLVMLPCSSNEIQHLPPPLFCCNLLLPFVVLAFTHLFFVLVTCLLPLSRVPALHPAIQSRCTPSLHLVSLPSCSAGLRLPLSDCFFWTVRLLI